MINYKLSGMVRINHLIVGMIKKILLYKMKIEQNKR